MAARQSLNLRPQNHLGLIRRSGVTSVPKVSHQSTFAGPTTAWRVHPRRCLLPDTSGAWTRFSGLGHHDLSIKLDGLTVPFWIKRRVPFRLRHLNKERLIL